MGFDQLVHFDDDQIATEYSALMSTVVWDGTKIVMPINEPADGRKKSQIQEYLETYDGPGVQHIALRTDDIVATVVGAAGPRACASCACPTPTTTRPGPALAGVDLPWDDLQRLNILVDRDHDGLPAADLHRDRHRPARRCSSRSSSGAGAKGFGEGNFKALFEAIERDQDRRGNL